LRDNEKIAGIEEKIHITPAVNDENYAELILA